MSKWTVWTTLKSEIDSLQNKTHPYHQPYGLLGTVVYYLGILLLIMGFLLLLPAMLAYTSDGNGILMLCFLVPALFSFVLGICMVSMYERSELYLGAAITLSALVWLIFAIIGAIPFWMAGHYYGDAWGLTFLEGVFEAMSGFTATGLTMYGDRVAGLPKSILFWRSLTQWVGGVGVIVLFLSVLTVKTGTVAGRLYSAEGRSDRLVPSVVRTTRRIWAIYAFYTLVLVLILFVLGMPFFDSINHSMTALATGGFSVKNQSIMTYAMEGHRNAFLIEMAIIPFMLIGGISFAMHYKLVSGNVKEFFENIEVRAILVISILTTIILAISLGLSFDSFRFGSFQTVTAITGTGFNTADVATWTDFQKFILTILMIFGGGFGSTASALKLIRVAILFYAVFWLVRDYLLPESVIHRLKLGRSMYTHEQIMDVAIYTVLYIALLVIGALVFMAGGATAANALFEVASAEGNVGLSVGLTHSGMPWWEKVTLIIQMWAGRLEIFPVLVLITSPFKKY